MSMKKFLYCTASFLVLLTACEDRSETNYVINTPTQGMFSSGANVYENGLIFSPDGTQAWFLDYASMQGCALCYKPNCLHKDSTCIANLCMKDFYTPIIYHDDVYYFSSEYEIVQASDGQSKPTLEIHSKCKRISLTGGTEETVSEFDGVDPTGSVNFVLVNDTLYFIASFGGYQWDDGSWTYANAGGIQYLCSIELENGLFTNYACINDSPYVENNSVVEGNSRNTVSDQVILEGLYDGKLYMYYQYVEDQEDLIEVLHEDGDLEHDVPWIYENKCFDLETGEITVSDLPVAATISENTYLYWDDEKDNYTALLADGTEITAEGFAEAYAPKIVDGKIWNFIDTPQCFDLETQTLSEIANETYLNCNAAMMDYNDGNYIVQYYDEGGNMVFDAVAEEKLIDQ